MSTYWHQKTINGDRQCCPWSLCSDCFDLLAPPSSFIRILHDTMLLTLRFDMPKSFESIREKPLYPVTSWQLLLPSMFRLNVYCDVTNFAPFLLLRHVGADKHNLFWNNSTKVVPGLIWMRADMTVYQPGDFLYNLLIKKSKHVIMWNIIQIRQVGKKLWPRHDVNRQTNGQTDRQTGWFLYTPQTLFAGGIKNRDGGSVNQQIKKRPNCSKYN